MRVPDEAMPEYFRLVLGAEPPAGAPPNEAKRALARGIVERFHDAARGAGGRGALQPPLRRAPGAGRGRGSRPGALPRRQRRTGPPAALMAGAFEISSSEARRLIKQGGAKLDGEPIPPDTLDLAPSAARRAGPAGRQAPLPPPSAPSRLGKPPPQRYTPSSFWARPRAWPMREGAASPAAKAQRSLKTEQRAPRGHSCLWGCLSPIHSVRQRAGWSDLPVMPVAEYVYPAICNLPGMTALCKKYLSRRV